MRLMDRVIAGMTKTIGSAVLVLMALQIVVDVFMRNLLGSGFPATTDIVSKYYMIVVSFLPVAFAEVQRRHVEASVFTDRMPTWLHPPIYGLGFVLSFAVYVLLAWGTAREATVQTGRGAYIEAGTILFPTWPGYWILPICFALMAMVLAMRLYQVVTGRFADVPSDQAAIAVPKSEME